MTPRRSSGSSWHVARNTTGPCHGAACSVTGPATLRRRQPRLHRLDRSEPVAARDGHLLPLPSWSPLLRRIRIRSPSGTSTRSSTCSAHGSERRNAPAKPSASSARSRLPISVSGRAPACWLERPRSPAPCPAWRRRWCGGCRAARPSHPRCWSAAPRRALAKPGRAGSGRAM
jgi:hypothetical protein